MTRVSARAGRGEPVDPPKRDEVAAAIDERVRSYMKRIADYRNPWRYCQDVGSALGLRQSNAKAALIRGEKRGELVSELRDSPNSGLGRRYYRWRT